MRGSGGFYPAEDPQFAIVVFVGKRAVWQPGSGAVVRPGGGQPFRTGVGADRGKHDNNG